MMAAACDNTRTRTNNDDAQQDFAPANQTRIIILGTIQAQHRTSLRYPLTLLDATLRKINPDALVVEIPPDRFTDAIVDYRDKGQVMEPRVARFPEYTDVVIPYAAQTGATLIPAAAWTQPMAEARSVALNRIARDPGRAEDWAAHLRALDAMNERLAGREDDPFFIHTDQYDEIIKQGLTPYATRFEDQLGTGDWEKTNRAHYELIAAGLDEIRGQGKTVVITFGAAHKYWFKERLSRRNDVRLVSAQPWLEAAASSLSEY